MCMMNPAAKSLQSCPTLCSPPGCPVPGILQARTLEWVAISFSNAWKWKVKVKSLSHVWLFETPWTAAHQAPPSMGFSRQEYWSGVPSPSLMMNPTYMLIYHISRVVWLPEARSRTVLSQRSLKFLFHSHRHPCPSHCLQSLPSRLFSISITLSFKSDIYK